MKYPRLRRGYCHDVVAGIRNALVASIEKAKRGGASDAPLRHFVDEESAARFLKEHSTIGGRGIPLIEDLFSENLAPPHKWLQAIYLTDGATMPVRPDHLGKILDVPRATASAMLLRLTR